MPVKKEVKVEEPAFVDEEGSYVHEKEFATYKGGIRRYSQLGSGADAITTTATGGAPPKNTAASPAAAAAAATIEVPSSSAVFRHGHGVYRCPAFTYTGNWEEDTMHGAGLLAFTATGHTYEGNFEHGYFAGTGTYRWKDGAVYTGQWRGNRMHGEGIFTDAQGRVWTGSYHNGTGPGLVRVYPALEQTELRAAATAGRYAAAPPLSLTG